MLTTTVCILCTKNGQMWRSFESFTRIISYVSVCESPATSIRHHAQYLDISRSFLKRIRWKDLHPHAYLVQLIKELKSTTDYTLCIMEEVDADFLKEIVFSDEAYFYLNCLVNWQNCRIAVRRINELVVNQKYPQCVTAFGLEVLPVHSSSKLRLARQ